MKPVSPGFSMLVAEWMMKHISPVFSVFLTEWIMEPIFPRFSMYCSLPKGGQEVLLCWFPFAVPVGSFYDGGLRWIHLHSPFDGPA